MGAGVFRERCQGIRAETPLPHFLAPSSPVAPYGRALRSSLNFSRTFCTLGSATVCT